MGLPRGGHRLVGQADLLHAGSDARGISTRARRHDGGWLINGHKTFISNAGTDKSGDRRGHQRDQHLVIARALGC